MYKNYFLFVVVLCVNMVEGRGSSYPYVAGDTFRAYCDHIYDETSCSLDPAIVKNGDTIFLKSDDRHVMSFFRNIYPQINAHFIVVSHNGDHSVPGLYNVCDPAPLDFCLLDYIDAPDSKIIIWFGQNIDIVHPKFRPIPIGIANQYVPHGNVGNITYAIKDEIKWSDRLSKLYLNFSIGTNRAVRMPLYQKFSPKDFCSNDMKRSHRNYLLEMKKYKFVMCPPGNGMDCHRTWEALMLGCIPLIQRSTLDALYSDLPVIIIDSWDEVSLEFLEAQADQMKNKTFNLEKIYFDYWIKEINSYKS